MSEWLPIETAPKDGTRILAYGLIALENEPGIGTVEWCDIYSVWHGSPNEASEDDPWPCKLTHWMPLPSAPLSQPHKTGE